MSMASNIRDVMQEMASQPNDLDYTPFTYEEIAKRLNDRNVPATVASVRNNMGAMEAKGWFSFVKGDVNPKTGRPANVGFTGLRDAKPKAVVGRTPWNKGKKGYSMPRRNGSDGSAKPTIVAEAEQIVSQHEDGDQRSVAPELERLAEARTAMRRFVDAFPGVVDAARAEAAIKVDPEKAEVYAREGLAVLDRLRWYEEHYRETKAQLRQTQRELTYLRDVKHNPQIKQALASAGVTHGD